jgi:predicted CoA-binding protein
LLAVPEPIEIVQLFRPARNAPRLVRQAVEIGAKAIWLQLGLKSPHAKRISEQAGLAYIEDRRMSIDCARLEITKPRSR